MAWRPARAWTSQRPVAGYRHFELITQGGRGPLRWVELAAVLAPAHRERGLWRELKDPTRGSRGRLVITESGSDPSPPWTTHGGG